MNKVKRDRQHNQRRGTKYQKRMRRKITRPERAFRDALKVKGVWFKHQPMFYDDGHLYLPDFLLFLNGRRVLIEIDGPEHAKKRASGYEHKRWFWLHRKRHIDRIIRFTNDRALNDAEGCVAEIMRQGPMMQPDPAWMATEPTPEEMPCFD